MFNFHLMNRITERTSEWHNGRW